MAPDDAVAADTHDIVAMPNAPAFPRLARLGDRLAAAVASGVIAGRPARRRHRRRPLAAHRRLPGQRCGRRPWARRAPAHLFDDQGLRLGRHPGPCQAGCPAPRPAGGGIHPRLRTPGSAGSEGRRRTCWDRAESSEPPAPNCWARLRLSRRRARQLMVAIYPAAYRAQIRGIAVNSKVRKRPSADFKEFAHGRHIEVRFSAIAARKRAVAKPPSTAIRLSTHLGQSAPVANIPKADEIRDSRSAAFRPRLSF